MKKILLFVALAFVWSAASATPLVGDHYKPKWTQLPDMEVAGDTLSMHRSFGPVVVDDFVSDGRPIAGFHWWGSYFEDAGQSSNERIVQFEISFHQNCAAGSTDPACFDPRTGAPYNYSTPKDGTYFSSIFDVEEDFYGTTADGVDIYEYWVKVDDSNAPSFLGNTWEEVAGETYWVDFAWNEGQFLVDDTGAQIDTVGDIWGWAQTNNGGNCIIDCAVMTGVPGGSNPHLGPWDLLPGQDMAFEVITVPEPGSLALIGLGLLGFGASKIRRAKK